MDWQARLYFKVLGKTYRVKVFEKTIGFERKPDGHHHFFDRQADPSAAVLYDTVNEHWDLEALARLIIRYEYESDVLALSS